jgi:hypothetical protein
VLWEGSYVEVADLADRGTVPAPWGEIDIDVGAVPC